MTIETATYGYEILTSEFRADRQITVLEMKKPRGKKVYLAVANMTADGKVSKLSVING